jgi:hypothetical protein
MKNLIKPILVMGLATAVLFGAALAPVAVFADDPPPDGDSVSLCAGQNTVAGTVEVWNDGDNLYVQYNTSGDWKLAVTHLAVACGEIYIPQNKKGNPKIGHFPYSTYHNPFVAFYTYVIPLDGDDLSACSEAGDMVFIAAHSEVVQPIDECTETVWQIGDVEVENESTGWLENYADEFNWGVPAGPITAGPSLGEEQPPFTSPFIVGTTPDSEFPYNSNANRGYATDLNVEWTGGLPLGGKLIISWSPGKSAAEKKVVSVDGVTTAHLEANGQARPGEGWFLDTYPLVEQTVILGPLAYGDHCINFKHTRGDGTFWDWIKLERPCEDEETAWGAACDNEGIRFVDKNGKGGNWATYFQYELQ